MISILQLSIIIDQQEDPSLQDVIVLKLNFEFIRNDFLLNIVIVQNDIENEQIKHGFKFMYLGLIRTMLYVFK